MGRFFKTSILILVVLVGCWVLYHRQQIGSPTDLIELARRDLSAIRVPVFQASAPVNIRSDPFFHKLPETLRMASFKLNGESGAAQQPDANLLLTEICKSFDLVAFQNVRADSPQWLTHLAGSLKAATGWDYAFAASPVVDGRQCVTLFNSNTLELEPSQSYSVNDPDDLYHREPFVCWFRAKQVAEQQAFTFSLVSIEVEPGRRESELAHLGDLYRAIRDDGRGEDDIILVGDFQCGNECLSSAVAQTGLQPVLSGLPTNISRTAQFDNIVFSPLATVESSGTAGVFDFMQQYNLFLEDALRISEHLPVWADFSIYEGMTPGLTANGKATERR
jgi:hypothetical protein